MEEIIDNSWAKELNCAITVCDKEGFIIYMNDKSISVNSKQGASLIGKNLKDCHPQHAWKIIENLIAMGGTNAYTISKNGIKKMIYQTAWKKNGQVAGLIEISMKIPEEIPHFNRG